jgi:hypothetical protein
MGIVASLLALMETKNRITAVCKAQTDNFFHNVVLGYDSIQADHHQGDIYPVVDPGD